ncbi:MAG: hypothetical protein WBB67_12090 [bacterium]
MLLYNKEKGIPVCPACGQELRELYVKRNITSYLAFDNEKHHNLKVQREKVFDENVFYRSACKGPIQSKDLFENTGLSG